MLEVKHITKYYGNNKAVSDLSFTVKKGEIFGLLGENGAGKTTTFRIIMGLIEASEGEVLLDGKKIDYNLNGQDYSVQYEPSEVMQYRQQIAEGYNKIQVKAYSTEGTIGEYEGEYTYTPQNQ